MFLTPLAVWGLEATRNVLAMSWMIIQMRLIAAVTLDSGRYVHRNYSSDSCEAGERAKEGTWMNIYTKLTSKERKKVKMSEREREEATACV